MVSMTRITEAMLTIIITTVMTTAITITITTIRPMVPGIITSTSR